MANTFRWYDFILPVVAVILAVGYALYVLNNPTDAMVAGFVTPDRIISSLITHLYLVGVSMALAILAAFPLGILLTRAGFRKFAPLVVGTVNIGQTVPSFAVIALFVGILGIGERTAIFALWVYSLLPILNNTIAGVSGVDRSIIDASRGMGMTRLNTLRKIEIPLAMPVIMAGIRTAVVINAGTAVIAAYVGAGGLGEIIVTGLTLARFQVLMLGALYAALVALMLDYMLGMVERLLPK
ncbi:MAG: ABC transporter permease [Defluviitaleaceae bacterium]|nr:ABC transporter permease [Defluviitaleaceae bacterium]